MSGRTDPGAAASPRGGGAARRTAVLCLAGGLVAVLAACMPDGTGARPSRLPDEGPLHPLSVGEPATTAPRHDRNHPGPRTFVPGVPDVSAPEAALTRPRDHRRSG